MKNDNWDYLGWEGLIFQKPPDWEPSHIEGDHNRGYVVLDDGIKCRIQLRWDRIEGEADIDKISKKQVKKIKNNIEFGDTEVSAADYKAKTFQGKKLYLKGSHHDICYYILQCTYCMRVVMMGFYGVSGENIRDISGKVIRSLSDHPQKGKTMWSVFGFCFSVPADMRLKSHRLHSGHLSLVFQFENDEIIYHRLSVANMHLKKKTMRNWLQEFIEKKYGPAKVEDIRGTDEFRSGACAINARIGGRLKLLKFKKLSALFWINEQRNNIYGVVKIGKGEAKLENFAGEVR